tara:strand:+ start:28 stop:225 length:198 start_codon:yes stop_codon:yes gene_type:complete
MGALDKLEAFCSLYGAAFYGVEPNAEMVTLVKEPWTLPTVLPFGDEKVVPFRAGSNLQWRLKASE